MDTGEGEQEKEHRNSRKRGTVLCNRRVDGPYTVLPNSIIQGANLTPEAFRLLAYVASLPDDWKLRIGSAAKRCRMGRDRTYNALAELEQFKLARLMAERAANGRIVRRWWEFTLTEGQWKTFNSEGEASERTRITQILDFRKRRKKPNPEIQEKAARPFPESPDMVSRTLQSNKRTKSNQNGSGGKDLDATEAWPFPDDDRATRAVRDLGLEPEAVWLQYLSTSLASPPKNLPAYLIGIAKRLAKRGLGKNASAPCASVSSMGAALNPDIAFAERNISINQYRELEIGEELRQRYSAQGFSNDQINLALPRALERAQGSRQPIRLLEKINHALSYLKENANKARKSPPATPVKPSRYGR